MKSGKVIWEIRRTIEIFNKIAGKIYNILHMLVSFNLHDFAKPIKHVNGAFDVYRKIVVEIRYDYVYMKFASFHSANAETETQPEKQSNS